MGEPTQGGDVLFSEIGLGGGVVLDSGSFALSDSVDLLVDLGPVEVAFLTGSGDRPGNSGGMPCSDTSNFPITSVGFFLEMPSSPPLHDSGEPLALGDSDDINEFVLVEDVVDSDFFFEEGLGEVDLVADGLASVDLDLEDVVLLLPEVLHQVVLGVADGSHYCAVLSDPVELHFDFILVLVLRLVSGEGFLFGPDPVLVEPPEGVLVEVVGPHC